MHLDGPLEKGGAAPGSAIASAFRPLAPDDLSGSVTARFRAVARALPDTLAVVSPGASLTFAALDAQADRVATVLLAELGSGREPIATLLPHSVSGVLGLLASLRTGRPVVPLDPFVPAARLEQILRQAGCVGCLSDDTSRPVLAELGDAVGRVVDITEATTRDLPARPTTPASPASPASPAGAAGSVLPGDLAGPTDVACLVFTSGSTGAPKGVVWTQGTLVNDAYAGALALGFRPGDRTALVLPYSFAAGLTVVVFGLLNGAGVYAYDPRALGIRDLPEWITSHRLTTLHTTPSLLRSLVGALAAEQVLPELRMLTTCGEAVYGGDIAAARAHLPAGASYVNWSGASEIASLGFFEIAPGDPVPEGTIPAGRPAAGKEVTIELEDGTQAAVGETGDVVVTSAYLSAGYWRAAEATAARFVTRPDGRMSCRTGDLGRFEPDGTVMLLGRRDAAVKIRGYLVEPSEVEAALLSSPEISEAVVIAVRNPPEPNRLVAYVVPQVGITTLSAAAIRRMLRGKLPSWMVPATIVPLPELPRTERGKIDRAALPPPPTAPARSAVPENQWEIVVADMWTRVLELEEVGVDDDFVELGGDSLAAEELRTLVAEELGIQLPATALIDAPTLAEFARKVSVAQRSGPAHPTIVPLRTTGSRLPLFCVAGSAQLALGYLSLARRLSEDQPVYAFQAHGLEQRGLPDWSIERAARRHLQLMRVIQPYGPYLIAGHSLGGLIGLEMAHQLEAAGEEVALLVLLDAYMPAALRLDWGGDANPTDPMLATPNAAAKPSTIPGKPSRRTRTGSNPGTGDGATRHGERSASAGGSVAREYRRRLKALRRVLLPERRTNLLNKGTLLRIAQLPLTGLVVMPGLDQFDAFFSHGRVLERFYRPKPWGGRALVYRAMHNPDPPEAWSTYLTGDHEYQDVPTEHFSMLREPHIIKIAAEISAAIDEIVADRAEAARSGTRPTSARSYGTGAPASRAGSPAARAAARSDLGGTATATSAAPDAAADTGARAGTTADTREALPSTSRPAR